MVREINHDTFFLGQKSEPATEADKGVAQDLRDTLKANSDRCKKEHHCCKYGTGRCGHVQSCHHAKGKTI